MKKEQLTSLISSTVDKIAANLSAFAGTQVTASLAETENGTSVLAVDWNSGSSAIAERLKAQFPQISNVEIFPEMDFTQAIFNL